MFFDFRLQTSESSSPNASQRNTPTSSKPGFLSASSMRVCRYQVDRNRVHWTPLKLTSKIFRRPFDSPGRLVAKASEEQFGWGSRPQSFHGWDGKCKLAGERNPTVRRQSSGKTNRENRGNTMLPGESLLCCWFQDVILQSFGSHLAPT